MGSTSPILRVGEGVTGAAEPRGRQSGAEERTREQGAWLPELWVGSTWQEKTCCSFFFY